MVRILLVTKMESVVLRRHSNRLHRQGRYPTIERSQAAAVETLFGKVVAKAVDYPVRVEVVDRLTGSRVKECTGAPPNPTLDEDNEF